MQGDFELFRKKFGSPTDIGADRVNVLRDFLSMYLPRCYGLGNGEIIDTHGSRSGQVDIIVCNQFHPYTYNQEGLGLFLAEGVDWAIEVKSNLATKLEEGMLQIKRIKALRKQPVRGEIPSPRPDVIERMNISCLLFGYDSPSIATLRKNIKRIASNRGISEHDLPNAVVALNKGLVLNIPRGDSRMGIMLDVMWTHGIIGVDLKEDTLFQMLIALSERLTHTMEDSRIILRYASFPEGTRIYSDKE